MYVCPSSKYPKVFKRHHHFLHVVVSAIVMCCSLLWGRCHPFDGLVVFYSSVLLYIIFYCWYCLSISFASFAYPFKRRYTIQLFQGIWLHIRTLFLFYLFFFAIYFSASFFHFALFYSIFYAVNWNNVNIDRIYISWVFIYSETVSFHVFVFLWLDIFLHI